MFLEQRLVKLGLFKSEFRIACGSILSTALGDQSVMWNLPRDCDVCLGDNDTTPPHNTSQLQ